jgi:hypothetical protein
MPAERETAPKSHQQPPEYNYEHFRTRHFLADLWRLLRGEGVQPGHEAPDFELESTEGGRVRLSRLRGRPIALHFVSYT